MSVQKVLLCPFHFKTRPSGVSLASNGLENIPQAPGNPFEVRQNYDIRKAVAATVSVLKWSRAIFRSRSSKVKVQKVLLCPFHCKQRSSGVSLECPGLESIPKISGNEAEGCQNHDARKVVSATLLMLRWNGLYFGPEARKWAFKKLCILNFTANQGHAELV